MIVTRDIETYTNTIDEFLPGCAGHLTVYALCAGHITMYIMCRSFSCVHYDCAGHLTVYVPCVGHLSFV